MNLYVYAAICAVFGLVLQNIFIAAERKHYYVLSDVLKGMASLMFVIIGHLGYAFITTDSLGMKIFIGLFFGMLGDIALNLRFILKGDAGQKAFLVGILLFLIGHILYLCALLPITPNLASAILVGAVLAIALLAYIFKTMEVKLAFKIFGVFYLGAVIIMTVMALNIAITTGARHDIIYAIGAVLFTASDIVLIFNTFSGTTKPSLRTLNLTLYYVGQLLIAGCLFIPR